jgi:hypothetical protein
LPSLYYTKAEADEKKRKTIKLILLPAEIVISGFAGEAYHSLGAAISHQPAPPSYHVRLLTMRVRLLNVSWSFIRTRNCVQVVRPANSGVASASHPTNCLLSVRNRQPSLRH